MGALLEEELAARALHPPRGRLHVVQQRPVEGAEHPVQPAEELPVPHPVARIAYFGELGDQAVRVVALHARQPHVRVRHQRQRPAGAGEHLHLVQRLPRLEGAHGDFGRAGRPVHGAQPSLQHEVERLRRLPRPEQRLALAQRDDARRRRQRARGVGAKGAPKRVGTDRFREGGRVAGHARRVLVREGGRDTARQAG
jgi:hypothetical protein